MTLLCIFTTQRTIKIYTMCAYEPRGDAVTREALGSRELKDGRVLAAGGIRGCCHRAQVRERVKNSVFLSGIAGDRE